MALIDFCLIINCKPKSHDPSSLTASSFMLLNTLKVDISDGFYMHAQLILFDLLSKNNSLEGRWASLFTCMRPMCIGRACTVHYVMLWTSAERRGWTGSARPWREVVSIKILVIPVCAAGGWGDNSGVRDPRLEPPCLCHSHIVAMDTHTQGATVKHTMLCHHSL